MGKSQNLSEFVCGGGSYLQVLPCHMVLSYTRVSTVSVQSYKYICNYIFVSGREREIG